MKKIILAGLCITSLLFGKDALDEKEKDKNFTPKEIKSMNKIFDYENSGKILGMLKEDFKKSTGDENFDKYLKLAIKDENWKKANYIFTYKFKDGKIPYKGEMKEVKTPEYEKALEYFSKSVKENKENVISAFQGFRILEKYFMYFGPNKITKKYLGTFSEVLMNKNYCLGYLYNAKSKTKKYGQNPNYGEIEALLEKGNSECKKEGVEGYYINGLKHELSLAKTMKKVMISKELKQGGKKEESKVNVILEDKKVEDKKVEDKKNNSKKNEKVEAKK